MTARHWIGAAALAWCSAVGWAQSAVSPWLVFDVPTDPRAAALGGRLVASLEADPHGALYAPQLVDSAASQRIAFEHLRYFGGMHATGVGYTWGSRAGWTWASGARFAGYGTFDGRDASGNATGTFSGGETVVHGTASRALNARWRVAARGLLGMRNLDLETAGLAGLELGVHGRFTESQFAVGAALTGWAGQIGIDGNQPSGRLQPNLQIGCVKGFAHAPFQLHLRLSDLLTWDLAPPGTYDPVVDPVTGEAIPSSTWAFGDRLMRHVGIGTEVVLSEALRLQVGFDYRRRAEMAANGRTGTNGFSIGTSFAVKQFQLRLSRNTYHFAGSSTHLALNIPLSSWL